LHATPVIANKNPRTEIRGKAAGSLREEIKDAARSCQFCKASGSALIWGLIDIVTLKNLNCRLRDSWID
jgi:hypothetical protein